MKLIKEVDGYLTGLRDKYDNLRANIADDFNDDWIDKALSKISELELLKAEIERVENLTIDIEYKVEL